MADSNKETRIERIKRLSKLGMKTEETERVASKMQLREDMEAARVNEIARWEDGYKRQKFEKNVSDAEAAKLGKSNIRIPLEFAYVESKTADEIETLPFPRVIPTGTEDIDYANKLQIVFDYIMNNVLNAKKTFIENNTIKNTLGDSFLKVYWNKEQRVIKNPMKKFKKETVTVYENIKIDIVDPRNFLIDPIVFQSGKSIDDASYCEFRNVYDFESFKQIFSLRGGFKNLDLVNPKEGSAGDFILTNEEAQAESQGHHVEVREFWDVLNDELTVIANDIEIRNTPCPYIDPFSLKKELPVASFLSHFSASGFYNISDIDLVKDLAEERQVQRNINTDTAKTYTQPFLAVGEQNDVDADEFVLGLSSILEVVDVNQVKSLTMQSNSGLPFSLEGANLNDTVIATGHDVSGVLTIPGETATKTLEKKESQMKRIRLVNEYNEVCGYRRLYGLIKNLMHQFYTKKMYQNILGKDADGNIMKLSESDIDRIMKEDFNVVVVANNQIPASREISKLRNQEMLQTLASLPFNPETGALPKYLIDATRVILQDMGIDKDRIDKALGQDDTQGGIAQALKKAKEVGLNLDEGSIGEFSRSAGTPKKSQEVGVQQQAQEIQNIIPS